MSFSFQAAGTVGQARSQINAAPVHGENSQGAKVKEFILGELDDWPALSVSPDREIGVVVEASGHGDGHSRTLTLTMRTLWLPIDPADAESAAVAPAAAAAPA